ncbi:hypothetical protein ACWDO7_22960 [Streptomyces sp. NPDC003656]
MPIENTQDPRSRDLTALLVLATGDGDSVLGAQERAGQAQLVHSDQLPTELHSPREDFEAVGFTFGIPDPRDPLFQPATLPDGWTKVPTDHDMWTYIVDQVGRRRASVFYKAVFNDRRAHMALINVAGYVFDCVGNGTPIVTDDTWATREEVAKAATARAADAEKQRTFWAERDNDEYVAEHTAQRDKYQAIAAEYGA